MACLSTTSRAISVRTGRTACRAPLVPRSRPLQARPAQLVRAQDTESTVEVDKIVKDLQEKWDKVENKTSVALYGVGGVVLIWFSSTLVTALNSIPLLPKLMELVGLGYTSWFIYRYLLFKSSREELVKDVDELKKKITGEAGAETPAAAVSSKAEPTSQRYASVLSKSAAAADDGE